MDYRLRPEIEPIYEKAWALCSEIAAADPNDAEAAAAALQFEFRLKAKVDFSARDLRNVLRIYTERYRALERRFPDSPAVQMGFAEVLLQWAGYHAIHVQADEAIPYLADARKRMDAAVNGVQDDGTLGLRRIEFLRTSRKMYDSIGIRDAARKCLGDARAIADSLLLRDPANLGHLFTATRVVDEQVIRATPDELEERIRETRSYLEKMLLLDPNVEQWIKWKGELLGREGFALASDRRLVEAHDVLEKAAKLLEGFPRDPVGNRLALTLQLLGTIAAQSGDFETAHACRDKLLDNSADFELFGGPGRQRELSLWVLLAELKDWPQLESILRDRINPDAELEPDIGLFLDDHARVAEAEYGRALVRQGRHEEALSLLEQAMVPISLPYRFLWTRFHYPESRRWETAELYAEALYRTGDYKKAVEMQEWALGKYEEHVATGGKLLSRIATARCAWKLAELLEATVPERTERRWELLDRAIELLDAPVTAPRLLVEERDMRDEIEAARKQLQEAQYTSVEAVAG